MKYIKAYFFVFPFLLFCNFLMAQNYQAIHGSSYAGGLGVANNPASIVDAPFAWDVTPFAIQVKQSTNAFSIKNSSLLAGYKNADISIQNGIKKRFFFANQDIHLLTTRISINSKSAIAFGANIRNYIYAENNNSNWQDSISQLSEFMKINTGHLPLTGDFAGSAWAEFYGTYAQTIIDDGKRILNAGLTIKINRALAGGYARARDINYSSLPEANAPGYLLTDGNLRYGYSSNFDKIDKNNSAAENRKAFLQNQYSTVSADIGFEYILLRDNDNDDDPNFYDTEIGVSLMDLGSNKYTYGNRSRFVVDSREGVTDSTLENKFINVTSFDNFNDSLAGIASSITTPEGNFIINKPARLVINIDKHLAQNFFINTEVTFPTTSIIGKNKLLIKDMNLLALTPRWETKSFGAYLPILYNSGNQLWIGGAFKAGPVLFGVHNISNLFSKNKIQNGGFYLAFTIRPGKKHERQPNDPREKLTRKVRRSLACPMF